MGGLASPGVRSGSGGGRAASARAAAEGADAPLSLVVDAAQAESVLFEAGARDALPPDGAADDSRVIRSYDLLNGTRPRV